MQNDSFDRNVWFELIDCVDRSAHSFDRFTRTAYRVRRRVRVHRTSIRVNKSNLPFDKRLIFHFFSLIYLIVFPCTHACVRQITDHIELMLHCFWSQSNRRCDGRCFFCVFGFNERKKKMKNRNDATLFAFQTIRRAAQRHPNHIRFTRKRAEKGITLIQYCSTNAKSNAKRQTIRMQFDVECERCQVPEHTIVRCAHAPVWVIVCARRDQAII